MTNNESHLGSPYLPSSFGYYFCIIAISYGRLAATSMHAGRPLFYPQCDASSYPYLNTSPNAKSYPTLAIVGVAVSVVAVMIISQHQYEHVSSLMGPYIQIPGSQMITQWLNTSLATHWGITCTSNHFVWLYYSGSVLESVPRLPQNPLTHPVLFHRRKVHPQVGLSPVFVSTKIVD